MMARFALRACPTRAASSFRSRALVVRQLLKKSFKKRRPRWAARGRLLNFAWARSERVGADAGKSAAQPCSANYPGFTSRRDGWSFRSARIICGLSYMCFLMRCGSVLATIKARSTEPASLPPSCPKSPMVYAPLICGRGRAQNIRRVPLVDMASATSPSRPAHATGAE